MNMNEGLARAVNEQPKKGKTYGYIRVSSDKQTVENQRFEIQNFCRRQNMKVDGWIEETISGTKSYSKRRLGALLKKVRKGDLIICSELSRLGRNLFMIMEILNICNAERVPRMDDQRQLPLRRRHLEQGLSFCLWPLGRDRA